MNLALISLILQGLGILAALVWYLMRGSKGVGSFEEKLQHLREDDDELRQAIEANKKMQEADYRELRGMYEELLKRRGVR